MRILLDECLPKRLKSDLKERHEVSTVQEMGWKSIVNGELLRRANKAGFARFRAPCVGTQKRRMTRCTLSCFQSIKQWGFC